VAGSPHSGFFNGFQSNPPSPEMNTPPATPSESDTSAQKTEDTTHQNVLPTPLEDDLDFGDVALGERQPEACSMEEGCERCQ
jgi:hypothetical protein